MINKQLVQILEDLNTEALAIHELTLVGVILQILHLVSNHIFDVCLHDCVDTTDSLDW